MKCKCGNFVYQRGPGHVHCPKCGKQSIKALIKELQAVQAPHVHRRMLKKIHAEKLQRARARKKAADGVKQAGVIKFAKAARAACASGKEAKERASVARYQRQTTDTLQSELDWYQAQADQDNRAKRG